MYLKTFELFQGVANFTTVQAPEESHQNLGVRVDLADHVPDVARRAPSRAQLQVKTMSEQMNNFVLRVFVRQQDSSAGDAKMWQLSLVLLQILAWKHCKNKSSLEDSLRKHEHNNGEGQGNCLKTLTS